MQNRNSLKLSWIAAVVISVVAVAGVVGAASTISTNISTGGTLSVTGASTLTGDTSLAGVLYASSTAVVTGDIFTYANGTFGNSATADQYVFTGGLQASSTALFGGVSTFYGNGTFGDSATADQYVFTGGLQASSTALFGGVSTFYGNIVVDKAATTTVTFSQAGINFDSNTFVVDSGSNRIGIGTSSPGTTFGVNGTTTMTGGLSVGPTGNPMNTILFGTCTYNPGAAITASTTLSTNCTSATGVRSGDKVFVTPSGLANHLHMVSASSTATDDVIQVSVYNAGWGGPLTPASASWSWMAIR